MIKNCIGQMQKFLAVLIRWGNWLFLPCTICTYLLHICDFMCMYERVGRLGLVVSTGSPNEMEDYIYLGSAAVQLSDRIMAPTKYCAST